ncbi:hypothetical protein BUALT_Bualt15G0078300 [Buddleja alternifolia]|uniref:Uncharacterized protein n=1 Tax=Buddleja alternifolia TaxID=168488 RepID=A0AAV6WLR7_9LAMI|nr:hypothetical protein BUALT_Bualt15G0078300 [Buddleja alternifolia]
MAKGTRGRRGIASRQCRPTPYPLPLYNETEDTNHKNCSKIFKKDWEDATCSVCMEYPHNAVLLLCSSHEKGCRPYMCGTSFRYSNCLDQYKKAYTKVTSSDGRPIHYPLDTQAINPFSGGPIENCEAAELACPLCRGQVKGWTVVEPAREHLNSKKRSCMQDNCTFIGTFKELRKHVKLEHPSAKPREVDPTLEQKWTRLEREREREDVMSTIRSSMPGAVFFGDYVIEGSHYNFDSDDDEDAFDADAMEQNEGVNRNLMSVFLFLRAFGSAGNEDRGIRRNERDANHTLLDRGGMRLNSGTAIDYSDQDSDDNDDNENEGSNGTSPVGRLRREGGVLLGRSGRRRRRIEGNGGPR